MKYEKRFWLRVWLEAAIVLALVAVTASAQEEVELPKVMVYDFPDSSIAGRESTSSVTIIDRDEIERSGAQDVYGLISGRVPGVFVNRRGIFNYGIGPGASGDLTIRGLGSRPNNQNLVLLDGQPTKMGIFGHPIPDAYPLEEVERVEVLRGCHSLHYGDMAMGGVVNIVTRKPPRQDGFSTRINAGGGEYHSYKAGLDQSGRLGDFSYFASVLRRETEGHRPNSAFEGWNGYAKAGYRLSDEWQVVLNGWGVDFDVEDPGRVSEPRSDDLRKVTRGGGGMTFYNDYGSTGGTVTVYGQRGRHNFTEVVDDGWKSHDWTTGLIARQSFQLFAASRLEAGGEFQESGGKAENARLGMDYGRFYRKEGGVYLDAEQALWEDFTTQAGLRLQLADHASPVWVPRVGVKYLFSGSTVLHGQVGKGYRAPTIRELYLFPPSSLDLKPEEAWNYEVGIRRNWGTVLSLDLTGFYLDAENLIVFSPPEAENIGSVAGKGIELGIILIPCDWFESLLSYSYLDQNKRVEQTAGNVIEWINRFIWEDLIFQAATSIVDDLKLSEGEEDYSVTDLRLSYRLTRETELALEVNNVFNESYEMVEGYPMPGRWLWGEVTVTF